MTLHKIKASQILHKIISTRLLTVLIMRVIVHTEQRKREKEIFRRKFLQNFLMFSETVN